MLFKKSRLLVRKRVFSIEKLVFELIKSLISIQCAPTISTRLYFFVSNGKFGVIEKEM